MLHDDLIHIPLIIKEPEQTAGKRLTTLSEQIDLMPTILDLAKVPVDGPVEGRSLGPVLHGEAMNGPIFSMNFEQNSPFEALHTGSVAMLQEHWKYVHYFGPIHYPQMPELTDSLYDLQADPGENTNLVKVRPEIAVQMRTAIDAQLRLHSRGRQ